MKRIIASVLFTVILFSCFCTGASALETSASGAVLMCAETGKVLYSHNADKQLSMASTTKIMTALLALEAASPDAEITVTDKMVNVEGTSMGLKAGDSVSLIELVYGMLLESGNDAANVTAYYLGGSPEKFAEMMNDRAGEIGMKNTHFVTPSGLDDDEHYSTAYDMALLACECISNPEFLKICSAKSARLSYGNPPYMRTLTNHNRLLRMSEDCVGIKTGFTKKSGRCLVSAAKREGVTLVAVTLNDPDDWDDHLAMFDYGFSLCGNSELIFDGELSLPIAGGDRASVPVRASRSVKIPECDGIKCSIRIKPFEYAPVHCGEIVGYAEYSLNGRPIAEIPLEADADAEIRAVPEVSENSFQRLVKLVKDFFRGETIAR